MVETKSTVQAKVNQALWGDGTPKDAKRTQDASKAAKSQPAKSQPASKAGSHPTARFLQDGSKAECQVLLKAGKQCSNPWNHTAKRLGVLRGTCSTHKNRLDGMTLQGLKAVRWATTVRAYDKTLWGAPAAPESQPAASKAASKAATAPDSQPAS